jgi:hypothetical protein
VCLAAFVAVATLLTTAVPASAESTEGPAFQLTGELLAKRDGVLTLVVSDVEGASTTATPPAVGDRFEVRIGRDARFLTVGRVYRLYVFRDGSAHVTFIRSVVHADGSPISTGLIQWREVRGALAMVACALVGLAGYRIYGDRHPRPRTPFS